MDIKQVFEKNTEEYVNGIAPLKGKSVLVALSGGADSVALLLCLKALSGKRGFSVSAFHVNHGIRGEAAAADEAFCAALCERKGIPFKVAHFDVPAIAAQNKQSLETCGRECRYAALEEHCLNNAIDYIVTAHNANDNAETVIYNLLRGSGTEGMCGIPKRRGRIIRPILWAERGDIEAYLSALNEGHVADLTNNDNIYTRNYIRNVIIPACKKVNGNAVGAINRASAALSDDADLLNEMAEKLGAEQDLRILPSAMQSRVIIKKYNRLYGSGLENVHVWAIKEALKSNDPKKLSLPKNVVVTVYNGGLSFSRYEDTAELPTAFLQEGKNVFLQGAVCIEWHPNEAKGVLLKKSGIEGQLYIRRRMPGDKLFMRKINRSVKKCFTDKKISPQLRSRTPIVCDAKGIIYVPNIGVADRVYPKKGDEVCGIGITIDERFGLKNEER